MASVNENTTINEQQTKSMVPSGTGESVAQLSAPWYIFRYKTLTRQIREFLQKHPDDMFFPYRKERKVHEATEEKRSHNAGRKPKSDSPATRIEYIEHPCIPGYIFVHADINDAIVMGQEIGLNPWRRKGLINEGDVNAHPLPKGRYYYSVSHKAMVRFMRVVSYHQNGIRIYDPSEIDPEENDIVEFISGELAGQRGYIQTEARKEGGTVIMPLITSEEDALNHSLSSENLDSESLATSALFDSKVNTLFHYGITAKPDLYRIIKFANPVRNRNCIQHANEHAKEILRDYSSGKPICESLAKKLRGYAIRYADAEMDTDIQRANLTLLLYRIYTILEDKDKLAVINQRITDEILPAFDQRINSERGSRKASSSRKKARFIEEKSNIDKAREQRQKRLSAQRQDTNPA